MQIEHESIAFIEDIRIHWWENILETEIYIHSLILSIETPDYA